MAAKTSKGKSVLLTGDVVIDHHIYEGKRPSPSDRDPKGTRECIENGGAGLLISLLQEISASSAKSAEKDCSRFSAAFGLQLARLREHFPPDYHCFALWEPCPAGDPSPGIQDKPADVWRSVKVLGYGCPADACTGDPQSPKDDTENKEPTKENKPSLPFPFLQYISSEAQEYADIIVLDDAGLGFRDKESAAAWPAALTEKSSANKPEWVILKMSNPFPPGDIWNSIQENKLKDRLIVIVSVEDLRREQARISNGISWERSTLDLAWELTHNPALTHLLKCAHLVVNFCSEGALWVQNGHTGNPAFRLICDPAHMEKEWNTKANGRVFGYASCLTASLVAALTGCCHDCQSGNKDETAKKPDILTILETGIKTGMQAMRHLHRIGHGIVGKGKPEFPSKIIADVICSLLAGLTIPCGVKPDLYISIPVPEPEEIKSPEESSWRILGEVNPAGTAKCRPLFGFARRIALFGTQELKKVPFIQFEKLLSVDRREIEALRGIKRLIKHYSESKDQSRPLSLAVFGPPGSGKSFAVKQIAKTILGDTPPLEFNLSQFENPKDLIGAFHQVRDKVLEGTMPIVFWDEFDSREYLWLQYLLAPMQDGKFQEGQITHPIGKCVFVFAGGTCSSLEAFCPPDPETLGKNVPEAEKREALGRHQHFKLMKGPDFASRLHGYLNVLGPNPLKCTNGKCECLPELADICFPIRRSLIIRSCQRMKDGERLKIDSGLLTALLEIGEYKHGSRSLEIILSQMKSLGVKGILRSGLPPSEVLSMHINEKEFYEIMTRHLEFRKQSHILAPYVHGSYLSLVDKNKWKVDYMGIYESLSAEIKEDNRVAAERIPKILELIGIEVSRDPVVNPVSAREVMKLIEENMEMMAEAEHEGWMEQKLANGWVYGEKRDNERKIHPALIPYGSLHEEDKEKDRNSISSYPDIVKLAGFRFGRIMK